MNNSTDQKLGQSPMLKLIISMSLPAMFSMLIQALYNIVDSIFVANYSDKALTAVSLAFPIQMLIIGVAVGTGIGLNSLISRRLGEKNIDAANAAADHGIILGILSGLLFAIFGIFFCRMFFQGFTDDSELVRLGSTYTSIVTIFSMGVLIQINLEKTLQATGDMIHPMYFQLAGAITNIILDPIFIFGFGFIPSMGIAGAAIATVIGQIVAMIFSLYIMFNRKHVVKISLKGFKFNGSIVKQIYAVGFPSIIMQTISSFLTIFLNNILIGFSQSAVSVLGVYYKLQSFVFMPVFGITQGSMPVFGYNFGAKNKERLTSALKISTLSAIIIMFIGTLIFTLFPKQLLMMFNSSPEIIKIGVPAFRILSSSFVAAAIGILFSTFFQAIGHGLTSLVLSIMRQLVIILPAAYLLARYCGLGYVWLSFPIAEVAAMFASIGTYVYIYKKTIRHLKADI